MERSRRQKCVACISADKSRVRTLGEIQRSKDGPWRHSLVRTHCRESNSHRARVCENCGYSKHVEFCHIKPISEFGESATLSEVNAENNVAILCRNCHWEMDHGLLVPFSWKKLS